MHRGEKTSRKMFLFGRKEKFVGSKSIHSVLQYFEEKKIIYSRVQIARGCHFQTLKHKPQFYFGTYWVSKTLIFTYRNAKYYAAQTLCQGLSVLVGNCQLFPRLTSSQMS
jgi:hypothetical protein